MAILEYKCPRCGGGLQFDSTTQKVKCPYCEGEFDISEFTDKDEALNEEAPEAAAQAASSGESGEQAGEEAPELSDTGDWSYDTGGEWEPGEQEGMRVYHCNSCGGEIIGDGAMAATSCPYCGNPVVMSGQFTGKLRPELVIPFKVTREEAIAKLENHVKGKRLLPKAFRSQKHIEEIKGIYVPFWLYDADLDARAHFRATKVRAWSDANYNYTETSIFALSRAGEMSFAGVPADGSKKMPDDIMESIEPYDLSAAVDFKTAYLAGYFADRYDVEASDRADEVRARMQATAIERLRETCTGGYTSVDVQSQGIHLSDSRIRYALLPVWMLNTVWNGKTYTFAMNGQTGKFVGDLPMDKSLYWKYFLGITAGVSAVLLVISNLLF